MKGRSPCQSQEERPCFPPARWRRPGFLPAVQAPSNKSKTASQIAEDGAGAAGATMVVSSFSTTAVEDIAGVARAPLWFQLYAQTDHSFTHDLVQRAEAAGCRALCLTVDTPVAGARNREARAKFELPPGM